MGKQKPPFNIHVDLSSGTTCIHIICIANRVCAFGQARLSHAIRTKTCAGAFVHRVGGNRNRFLKKTTADQKSLETVYSIAICHQSGDK